MYNVENGIVKIYNITDNHDRYVVCRLVDGKLWYYTSWKKLEDAESAAEEFDNGIVVEVE